MSFSLHITCEPGVKCTPEEIKKSRIYTDWYNDFQPGWFVESIRVQVARKRQGTIRALVMDVTAIDDRGRTISGLVLLSGPSVDILTILNDGTDKYVVFVEQPRLAVGGRVVSNPAGMIEDGENPEKTAFRELQEEVGLDFSRGTFEWLSLPQLPSPGYLGEYATYCVVEISLPTKEILELNGRETGLPEEEEYTTLRVKKLDKALPYLDSLVRRDQKARHSLSLYFDAFAQ